MQPRGINLPPLNWVCVMLRTPVVELWLGRGAQGCAAGIWEGFGSVRLTQELEKFWLFLWQFPESGVSFCRLWVEMHLGCYSKGNPEAGVYLHHFD